MGSMWYLQNIVPCWMYRAWSWCLPRLRHYRLGLYTIPVNRYQNLLQVHLIYNSETVFNHYTVYNFVFSSLINFSINWKFCAINRTLTSCWTSNALWKRMNIFISQLPLKCRVVSTLPSARGCHVGTRCREICDRGQSLWPAEILLWPLTRSLCWHLTIDLTTKFQYFSIVGWRLWPLTINLARF